MPASLLQIRAQAELERRRRAQEHIGRTLAFLQPGSRRFTDFIARHNPTLLEHWHVRTMADVLQRVADGVLKRVLFMMPPRYWKTEVTSKLFPAYLLKELPTASIGLASHGAGLAWENSEEARSYYQRDDGALSRDTRAKRAWKTPNNGRLWATGVSGGFLGYGYHFGVVDDPRNPEQVDSYTYQQGFERWFPGKWLSRQEPGAAIVVVAQRLGVHDPFDFLLRREVGENTDLAPQHWHVVCFDEIRSMEPLGRWTGPQGLPPTCTLEPDPRAQGEVLAPGRFSAAEVKQMQTSAGPLVTAAQRQQRPGSAQGDFWRKEWFGVYDELPADVYNGGTDWDTAYTEDDRNAATAWLTSFRGPGAQEAFPVYVHDVDWEWLEFPEQVQRIRAKAGPHYVEDKATGKSNAQALRREGVHLYEVSVKGSKLTRATLVQGVVASRRVLVRRSVYQKLLHGERQGLLGITVERLVAGRPDLDVNDVFVQALARHYRPVARQSAKPPGRPKSRLAL